MDTDGRVVDVEFINSTANQSSKIKDYPAICAINEKHKTCRGGTDWSYTNSGVGEWWKVDFKKQYWVHSVNLLQNNNSKGGGN